MFNRGSPPLFLTSSYSSPLIVVTDPLLTLICLISHQRYGKGTVEWGWWCQMFLITVITIDDLVLASSFTGIHKGRLNRFVDPRLSCRRPVCNLSFGERCTVDRFDDYARCGAYCRPWSDAVSGGAFEAHR